MHRHKYAARYAAIPGRDSAVLNHQIKCGGRDLNPHPLRDQLLRLARLPFRHRRL